jgi:hypothetical protein
LFVAPVGLAQFALQDLARRTLALAILACLNGCPWWFWSDFKSSIA